MANDQNIAEMLINQDCPFGYQCKALDCLECEEIRKENKEDVC